MLDRQGSVQALTDDGGALQDQYSYDPYGNTAYEAQAVIRATRRPAGWVFHHVVIEPCYAAGSFATKRGRRWQPRYTGAS